MKRREFLSTVAALPVLGAAAGAQTKPPAAPAAGKGLKLGIVTYNIAKDWDVPTIIKNLTEARFDAVELRTTHKHGVEIALSKTERAATSTSFSLARLRATVRRSSGQKHGGQASLQARRAPRRR